MSSHSNAGERYQNLSIVFCSAAIASLVPVVLAQVHVIDSLPDPPGRWFNSDRIVRAKNTRILGIPDGVLGIGSYSVTLALLIAARSRCPVAGAALRAKLLFDGTMAARKARSQKRQFGQLCSWCLGTAVATAGMIHFARKARRAK